jgi:hypothetical protein
VIVFFFLPSENLQGKEDLRLKKKLKRLNNGEKGLMMIFGN